jgi:hypothetical protein
MTIKSVYQDPKTSTRDPKLLAERAKVTIKSAKAFLRDQSSVQVSKRWRKPAPAPGVYSPTGAPSGHYQADVMFLDDYRGVNKQRGAILTVMNTTTRAVSARALLNAKSATTAKAMAIMLDNAR